MNYSRKPQVAPAIAKRLEIDFQGGSGRAAIFQPNDDCAYRSLSSAAEAKRVIAPGERCAARVKCGRTYEWRWIA